MEGILQEGALYRALIELAGDSSTGILTVQGEEEIIAFSLLEGEIVSADALNQTLEEALGELLVRRQLVAADDFGGLAAEYQAGGGRVVDLLVERAYLTRDQLLDLLREHTYRLCLEAFTWLRGEYRFYKGEEVAYEEGFRSIDIDELCVRATLDLGPSGPLAGAVPEPSAVPHQVPTDVPPRGDELAAVRRGNLSPSLAERIYEMMDGRRSLEAVASGVGVSRFTVQHLAYLWAGEGLVTVSAGKSFLEPLSEESVPASEPVGGELEETESVHSLDLDKELALEPQAEASRQRHRAREGEWTEQLLATPWPSRAMGLGLWVAVAFLLFAQPSRLLLPFPWQGGLRDAYEKQQRAVLHLKIEEAATTFFLLNGRFPEELEELASTRLLAARDLSDPSGRDLVMTSATASYLVETTGESADEKSTLTATIGIRSSSRRSCCWIEAFRSLAEQVARWRLRLPLRTGCREGE